MARFRSEGLWVVGDGRLGLDVARDMLVVGVVYSSRGKG